MCALMSVFPKALKNEFSKLFPNHTAQLGMIKKSNIDINPLHASQIFTF